MTEFLAKDFNDRQELETKVSSVFGLTADSKPDHVIKGTKDELRKLHLGQGNIFWGIPVAETDYEEPAKRVDVRVDRGEIHKSEVENVDIKNSEDV